MEWLPRCKEFGGLSYAAPRIILVIGGLCIRGGYRALSINSTRRPGTAVSGLPGAHVWLANAQLVSHRHSHRPPAVTARVGAWSRRVRLPIRVRVWTTPDQQFSRARSGSRIARRYSLSFVGAQRYSAQDALCDG